MRAWESEPRTQRRLKSTRIRYNPPGTPAEQSSPADCSAQSGAVARPPKRSFRRAPSPPSSTQAAPQAAPRRHPAHRLALQLVEGAPLVLRLVKLQQYTLPLKLLPHVFKPAQAHQPGQRRAEARLQGVQEGEAEGEEAGGVGERGARGGGVHLSLLLARAPDAALQYLLPLRQRRARGRRNCARHVSRYLSTAGAGGVL